jgi:hypothetical protein
LGKEGEAVSAKFSKPNKNAFEITPLGAAIVEAMPDRKAMRRIQSRFKKYNECPASVIFNLEQVERFYAERGQSIKAT